MWMMPLLRLASSGLDDDLKSVWHRFDGLETSKTPLSNSS
jgi:hypothetical protein